jgi:cyclopropane-fatty-acyl-phospholipid synthase
MWEDLMLKRSHIHPFELERSPSARSPSTPLDHWLLRRLQLAAGASLLRFVLWDGFEWGTGPSTARIVIKTRAALIGLLWRADLYFGEAYMFDELDVEGDLVEALEEIYRTFPLEWQESRSWSLTDANALGRARHNVHHHYDLGNHFYQLWLDPEMLYTCAYFPEADCSLESAQLAKMELVCRKLRLRPGERVVDAGCGWGALALYMAREHGVSVRAFNISAEQIAYARERAAREKMAGRVEFVEDDYRNITGSFDAFVSVGMLEHVGLQHYRDLGDLIARTLTPNGRGLLHFIGRNRPTSLNRWIRRRIFPGGYPPTLREVFHLILEPHAFSVLDVENLRLHYAKTLEHWRARFAAASHQISGMFDPRFIRAWRLYLAGSQAAFSTGWMQLFQVVFARGDSNAIPWTRMS